MIETGYSWSEKDYDRTILVFNKAFGDPKDLPVDFGDLRWPISYNLDFAKFNNRTEKDRVFKELVGDLKKAIESAIRTAQTYQRKRFSPFKQFNDWKSEDFKRDYQPISELKDKVKQLRNGLQRAGNPQRIVGPKHSGKTRLAREMYCDIDENIKKDESIEKILYYDLSVTNYSSIEVQVLDLARLNQDKVVIIDNCPYLVHKQIVDALCDSNVRILTIYEKNEQDEQAFGTVEIEPDLARKVSQLAIRTKFSGSTASAIIDLVDGNVRAALAYVNSDVEDNAPIETGYESKWRQLIGAEAFDQGGLKLLETLSVFKYVGVAGDYSNQGDFVRTHIVPEMSVERFQSLINIFTRTGILKRQGDFVLMETFSAELAKSWWRRNAPDDLNRFLLQISKEKLSRQFGERLIDLSEGTTDGDFTEIVVGSNDIFDFDFISTQQGAQLILNLAEIAPIRIISLLEKCFDGKTRENLLDFGPGRRNIIWALERLCFRSETFAQAASFLFRLAVSENENIGNNATSQFVRLFQPYLAGTEANLLSRLQLLFKLKDNDNSMANSIVYSAFSMALKTRDFFRDGGAEDQAGKKLRDHVPDDVELSNYRKSVLEYLISIDDENRTRAEMIITERFKMLFIDWEPVMPLEIVKEVIIRNGKISRELRQQLADITSGRFNVSKEDALKVQGLLDLGKPKELRDELNLLIIVPSYEFDRSVRVDKSQERAINFAKSLIEKGDIRWLNELYSLQIGEQRQTFSFAQKIGELIQNRQQVIDKAIEELSKVSFEEQNDVFIRGFVSGVKDDTFTRRAIDKLLEIPSVSYHAIRLTQLIQFQQADLEKLKPTLENNPNFIAPFLLLKYNHLSDDVVVDFLTWLKNIDFNGVWAAIDILEEIIRINPERWDNLKDLTISLVQTKGLIRSPQLTQIVLHQYEILIKKLISTGIEKALTEFLVEEIVESTADYVSRDYILTSILSDFLEREWETAWPLVGPKILDRSFDGWFSLRSILSDYNKFEEGRLLEWVSKAGQSAPTVVVEFLNFEANNESGELIWNPIVKKLIDTYGDNQQMLRMLSGRLHSFSATGSAMAIFETRKELVSQLKNHPLVEVREFAEAEIIRFDQAIEGEGRFLQNLSLGEW